MGVKKLLFPTKFRAGSLQFLKKLLVLKKAGLEEVTVLHIIEKEKVSFDYAGYLKEVEEKLKKKAEEILKEWEEEFSKEINFKYEIVVGIPEYEVLEREENFDLIAMGKPSSGLIKKLFMGSTTMNILAHVKKPVLVAKFEEEVLHSEKCLFCKVLLATDGSEPCKRALGFIKSLAPVVEEVDILAVQNVKRKESREPYEKIVEEFAKELEGVVKVDTHILEGTPSKEILRFAESIGSSMIVVGTTGKDAFEEMIIGSTSHRVLEKSKLPVLVIP